MKIRTQLNLLIVALITLPVVCLTFLPLYHYMTSSQRHLMKGYQEIRKIGDLDLSEDDWDTLEEYLEHIRPNVEVAVYYNSSIIISTIPELKAGTAIDFFNLMEFIGSSSGDYDYQVQAPLYNFRQEHYPPPLQKMNTKIIAISRSKVPDSDPKRGWTDKTFLFLFIIFIIFECFCISMIIRLSKTITSSITILEDNTNHIANGELYYQLQRPSNARFSNEITSLTDNLDKMRLSLKDDQERRSKFIMGLSHDLRTPVALIKGYTEALTDGVVNDKEQINKSLNIIHSKADQLENMINDLINYMKLNTTDWLHKLEYVSIYPIIMEFAEACESASSVYKRNITKHIDINTESKVRMDKKLFDRALENLFSNALRYTKEGDSIEISAVQDKASISIAVKDTGCGISEKDSSHIYDIFYRGTNSRREAGMGIGLSVVKSIIDTHGWSIDFKSEVDKGTTFIITIPLS